MDTFNLLSLVVGVLGLLASPLLFYLDKRYYYVWDRLWRFKETQYSETLVGNAVCLHSLSGLQRSYPDGITPKDVKVSLKEDFPAPEKDESTDFKFENISLMVNQSRNALLEGTMNYAESGKMFSAKIYGKGYFISKDAENFDGFVTLDCKLTEISPDDQKGLTWTASYSLRYDPKNKKWNGFWLLFDRQLPKFAGFGKIEFNEVVKKA